MSGNVVVVTAMREEAHHLGSTLEARDPAGHLELESWDGRVGETQLTVVVTGIGKVASALAVQYVIDRHHPDWLLVTGIAGAAGEHVPRGTLVVPSRAVQWDVDARPLMERPGFIPGMESEFFPADTSLVDAAKRACEASSGVTPLGGTILTGDAIIASAEHRDRLRHRYPDATCVDMETAAVAHVASANGVPWVGIRMVSDSADDTLDVAAIMAFTADRAATELAALSRELITLVAQATGNP